MSIMNIKIRWGGCEQTIAVYVADRLDGVVRLTRNSSKTERARGEGFRDDHCLYRPRLESRGPWAAPGVGPH